jgi:hypothetical protein
MSLGKNYKEIEHLAYLAGNTVDENDLDGLLGNTTANTTSKITLSFIEAMREFLNASSSNMAYRSNPKNFTRKRYFSFKCLAIAILKEHTRSIHTQLKHLYKDGAFGNHSSPPSASAFCQARLKLQPAFFKDWTKEATNFFYTTYSKESLVDRWKNRTLKAVDGSKFRLPNSPETRKAFTVHENQFPNSQRVFGQVSLFFDVLNEIPINACLERDKSEIDYVINNHCKYFREEDIVIYDRGYASYAVPATHVLHGGDFVIRIPTSKTFTVVREFIESTATDAIVTINMPKRLRPQGTKRGWPPSMKVRLVKVILDNGSLEVLMTSLLDQVRYQTSDFKWLYFQRWAVETAFDRLKNHLETECFSSKKMHNIMQEFHAMVFLQVFEAIVNKVQERELAAKSKKKD